MVVSLLVFNIQHSLFHICQELEIYVLQNLQWKEIYAGGDGEPSLC